MPRDNIRIDTRQLNNIGRQLRGLEREMPGAAASALNRTVDYINTQVGRIVTQEYSIKTTTVKKTIKKHKARRGELSAKLVSQGHLLSLANFPFSPKSPGTKRKVKVKIKKQGGRKTVNTSPSAFVQNMNNSLNVFMRVGEERKPIVVLRTLSIPQMIGNEDINRQIQRDAQAKLSERIEHEVQRRLNRIRG
ncbi:minor tail protein Z (GPZ) [Anaerobacterium chartisolvens]|uniref:Minor tail protein Z (GPZ) n=1 Tax=Anaerobacterium chartisolvens TaxID=1297424 RepID=A0A369BH53_9FIRM|nr:phage tail protein [Anaerobacterium chartisolvens]RCX20883.1 minor tail protein Z (GPZ) [Anaerobacterium chartisolvens]